MLATLGAVLELYSSSSLLMAAQKLMINYQF